MNDARVVAMMTAFVLCGVAVAGLWGGVLLRAAARRRFGEGEAVRSRAEAGAGRVMLAAAFGVAMGVVTACGGLLGVASAAGGRVDLPEAFLLFLLAIPVGIVVCPGLVLWGLVAAWRVAEQDPVDPRDVAAAAAGVDGELDALDAPFAPPPAGRGGGG